MTDDQPFFPYGSAIRRVHREGVLLLGGGRALFMQIAHPDVARGVAEHSAYRRDRLDRLLSTVRAVLAMAFGTQEQALRSSQGINQVHAAVRGDGYSAFDPELLTWVLATLIDTTYEVHERFLGPIPPELASRYYEDMRRFGEKLQVPADGLPGSAAALRRYVRQMCQALEVSDVAGDIARELLKPLPGTGPLMLVMRQLTAGLLPPPLRGGYGLKWGPLQQAQLQVLQQSSRSCLPLVPLPLRRTPSFLMPST